MGKSKQGGGYSCKPITATIKKTTRGGLKVEQPLLNMGAAVQMNAPGSQAAAPKNLIKAGSKLLPAIVKGGKKALPAIKKGGAEALKRGKEMLGKGAGKAVEYVPKRTFMQNAKKFIKNAAIGGVGYAIGNYAIGKIFGGDDESPAPKPTEVDPPKKTKKYDTNMKDFALNSQARRDEYTRRGWKQDHTTELKKKPKVETVSKIETKPIANLETKSPKVSIDTKIPSVQTEKVSKVAKFKAKKNAADGARKTRKAVDKEKEAKQALAEGKTGKARRKQRAADRKKRKAKKKFSQAAGAIGVPTPIMKNKKY